MKKVQSMSEFNVEVTPMEDFAVIRSQGYINNLGGERIAQECYDLMDRGYQNFIINLDKSKVVNSIGISILIEIIEKIVDKKGQLAFSNLTPTIAKTLKIMGLLQYADSYEDENQAISAFQNTR